MSTKIKAIVDKHTVVTQADLRNHNTWIAVRSYYGIGNMIYNEHTVNELI